MCCYTVRLQVEAVMRDHDCAGTEELLEKVAAAELKLDNWFQMEGRGTGSLTKATCEETEAWSWLVCHAAALCIAILVYRMGCTTQGIEIVISGLFHPYVLKAAAIYSVCNIQILYWCQENWSFLAQQSVIISFIA